MSARLLEQTMHSNFVNHFTHFGGCWAIAPRGSLMCNYRPQHTISCGFPAKLQKIINRFTDFISHFVGNTVVTTNQYSSRNSHYATLIRFIVKHLFLFGLLCLWSEC